MIKRRVGSGDIRRLLIVLPANCRFWTCRHATGAHFSPARRGHALPRSKANYWFASFWLLRQILASFLLEATGMLKRKAQAGNRPLGLRANRDPLERRDGRRRV